MWEKFRFASKEDADPFYYEEKFRSASKKDANPFYLKKNSELHLRKMQICFIWRKIQICIWERCRSVLLKEK